MPASEGLDSRTIERLGIIAGGGALPLRLARACEDRRIRPFIVAFRGMTDPALVDGRDHIWTRPGAAGTIVRRLRREGVSDLVLIGALKRPGFFELWPDFTAFCFFMKAMRGAPGDDRLLRALRSFLEEKGFRLHGVQKFVPGLLTPAGVLGRHAPSAEEERDIARGMEAARALGRRDAGQAVIIQAGAVAGLEGPEGTDALIRRSARGGVLVKMCKPQQDRALDLPAIGPETVRNAADAELSGIALEAGASLLSDPEEIIRLADERGLFIVGIKAET